MIGISHLDRGIITISPDGPIYVSYWKLTPMGSPARLTWSDALVLYRHAAEGC